MDRRTLLKGFGSSAAATAFAPSVASAAPAGRIMTVLGWLDADKMGVTLSHEHLVADVRPLASRPALPLDAAAVEQIVLLHLADVKKLGCRTIVDCTAVHLGREPALLKQLSQVSGMHILTTTGVYAAANRQFLPDYAASESAEALAARWIGEWQKGIDDTGVRPGLIKIGINGGPLTDVEAKIIDAAAHTHLASGLTIAAHTGPWSDVQPGHNALSAHQQIDRLEAAGVSPSAFIWVHAQNEGDLQTHVEAARRGAWISYDNVAPDAIGRYADLVTHMKDKGFLKQIFVSHDAGWYSIGQPNGGTFRPFTPVFTHLIPALESRGFSTDDIRTLMVLNPARAFAVRKRVI